MGRTWLAFYVAAHGSLRPSEEPKAPEGGQILPWGAQPTGKEAEPLADAKGGVSTQRPEERLRKSAKLHWELVTIITNQAQKRELEQLKARLLKILS